MEIEPKTIDGPRPKDPNPRQGTETSRARQAPQFTM